MASIVNQKGSSVWFIPLSYNLMAIHIHVPKFGCLNIIFGSKGLFFLHGRSLSWRGHLMVLQWETETEAWNWATPLGVQFLRTCFMNSIFQSSRARINSATDEDCNWLHVMKTPCLKWPKTGSAIYSPLKCPKSGRVLVFIFPPPFSHPIVISKLWSLLQSRILVLYLAIF